MILRQCCCIGCVLTCTRRRGPVSNINVFLEHEALEALVLMGHACMGLLEALLLMGHACMGLLEALVLMGHACMELLEALLLMGDVVWD